MRCLLYHALSRERTRDPRQYTVPLSLFEEQMDFLARHRIPVLAVSQVVSGIAREKPFPRRAVCLTFDDGHSSVEDLAVPVLRKYRFPAAVFLVAESMGKNGFLGWEQARGMQAGSDIEIGCHGLTHRLLRGLSEPELEKETLEAKRRLEEGMGGAVALFAYPFGSFGSWDAGTLAALRRAGFHGAFTSVFGLNTSGANPLLLRRCRVSWQQEIPDFQRLLEGAYDWYAGIQRLQGSRPFAP